MLSLASVLIYSFAVCISGLCVCVYYSCSTCQWRLTWAPLLKMHAHLPLRSALISWTRMLYVPTYLSSLTLLFLCVFTIFSKSYVWIPTTTLLVWTNLRADCSPPCPWVSGQNADIYCLNTKISGASELSSTVIWFVSRFNRSIRFLRAPSTGPQGKLHHRACWI